MTTQQGFLIFHFKSEDDVNSVMEKGPWMLGGIYYPLTVTPTLCS
jgi:hypothetical protein